jgi:hypothetical protein
MNPESVLLQKADQIATITLNQPATLNALTYDMVVRLGEVLDDLARDRDVRSVLLTGAGRGFCSGANLLGGSGETLGSGGMGVRAAVMAMNEILAGITEMQEPWLAAVGILWALLEREWTGRGQWVDASLLGGALACLSLRLGGKACWRSSMHRPSQVSQPMESCVHCFGHAHVANGSGRSPGWMRAASRCTGWAKHWPPHRCKHSTCWLVRVCGPLCASRPCWSTMRALLLAWVSIPSSCSSNWVATGRESQACNGGVWSCPL